MIINDDLTGMVLGMGCFIGAVVGGIIGALSARSLVSTQAYWISVALLCFVIGYLIVALIMNVIRSAVATTYVVWAEDNALLLHNRPEHYEKHRNAANVAYAGQAQGQW